MKTTIRGGSTRRVVVAVLTAAVMAGGCGGNGDEEGERTVEAAAATDASADYPKASPKNLAQPFAGEPVPSSWFGRWRVLSGDFDNHILPADSPECRSITTGRTTCWTVGPIGSSTKTYDVYAAGAITLDGQTVVWRMTYNPDPSSPRCFEDDAYHYRYTQKRIYVLMDDKEHCHYERSEAAGDPTLRKANAFAILTRVG